MRYGERDGVAFINCVDHLLPISQKVGFYCKSLFVVAFQAKERANGMELDGRRIRVDFSITKRAHTPTPGIYMGRPT